MQSRVLFILLATILLTGCFGKGQRKSGEYYAQHADKLQVLKKTYDSLYQYQSFSVGYTDKSFKYYFVEFTTDSIRWVYNNETGADSMVATFHRIGYSPERFERLLDIMKSTKCLWVDKVKRIADGKPAYFTYMSFGSVLVDKPFVENKYYALIFPNDPTALSAVRRSAKRGGIVAINDSVFFTIANRFR